MLLTSLLFTWLHSLLQTLLLLKLTLFSLTHFFLFYLLTNLVSLFQFCDLNINLIYFLTLLLFLVCQSLPSPSICFLSLNLHHWLNPVYIWYLISVVILCATICILLHSLCTTRTFSLWTCTHHILHSLLYCHSLCIVLSYHHIFPYHFCTIIAFRNCKYHRSLL